MSDNSASALITFGATLAGVLASFLLGFLSFYIIKRVQDRKNGKATEREIEEETEHNIILLDTEAKAIAEAITKEIAPLTFHKLVYPACDYALTSGDIRTIPNKRKQRLVQYIVNVYENYNNFVSSSENLIGIWTLHKVSLNLITYRLQQFIEHSNKTKEILQGYLNKFRQKNLNL